MDQSSYRLIQSWPCTVTAESKEFQHELSHTSCGITSHCRGDEFDAGCGLVGGEPLVQASAEARPEGSSVGFCAFASGSCSHCLAGRFASNITNCGTTQTKDTVVALASLSLRTL